MEELLAAAGYTATRVFTPETERTQKMQEQAKDEHKDAGLGSMFAGWIAHILPVTAPSSSSTSPTSPKPRVEEDVGSNPFLSADADAQFPQTTRSVSTPAPRSNSITSSSLLRFSIVPSLQNT
jgi:hypothetical protein